jgi:PP-loop superfamily ATP-utilizing enzyme
MQSIKRDDDCKDIDVVSVGEYSLDCHDTKPLMMSPKKDLIRREILPCSLEAHFVRDTASQIGVRLSPTAVLADDVPYIVSYTSAEMIASAMRTFINELLRHAASLLYQQNRCPDELTPVDVYNAALSRKRYEFLTNRWLGAEPIEDDSEMDE